MNWPAVGITISSGLWIVVSTFIAIREWRRDHARVQAMFNDVNTALRSLGSTVSANTSEGTAYTHISCPDGENVQVELPDAPTRQALDEWRRYREMLNTPAPGAQQGQLARLQEQANRVRDVVYRTNPAIFRIRGAAENPEELREAEEETEKETKPAVTRKMAWKNLDNHS